MEMKRETTARHIKLQEEILYQNNALYFNASY